MLYLQGEEHNVTNSFVIYVDGVSQSWVAVLKLDGNAVVECAHSILPPELKLIYATGGILTSPDGISDPIAVVCGGEVVPEDTNTNYHFRNEKCSVLAEEVPVAQPSDEKPSIMPETLTGGGVLLESRSKAVSLVINHGSTLWLMGGFDWYYEANKGPSEFMSVSHQNSSLPVFQTNLAGPVPAMALFHHCLAQIGPEMAIVTGGKEHRDEGND